VAGAVKERCIFVSCPNHRVRGERDPQLFGKLRAEIGAFAATCIELARRVVARGYYPMSYAMKHMTDVIARDGNHVKAFVAECCIVGVVEDWSVSESIYGAYLSYCTNNGHKSPLPNAESRNLFGNTQMRLIGTSKVSTDPFSQLVSRKQAIGLDHIALSMDPFGLNGVEPWALRR
jgi:phage/plasmid-associated DNA primase